jgi:lipopolysaccharide export system permease protein
MYGSILNRLIFWELVKVFLMSLGTLTGLLVAAGLLQQAAQMGLSPEQVIGAIPLFVPNTLPYTIPATTLFASCVVYGRLAHDNEIVAIKGAGVHLAVIIKPTILLGVLTTLVTAGISHTIIPVSQQLLYKQLTADPEELIYNILRRERCLRHHRMPYVIYVKDVQGKRLIDVVLKERAKFKNTITGQEEFFGYRMVARAREAKLRVDPADGNMYLDPERFVIYNRTTSGSSAPTGAFKIDLPDGVKGKDRIRISALTWDELPVKIAAIQEELDGVQERRELNSKIANAHLDPNRRQIAQGEDRVFKYQVETLQRTIRNIEGEYHVRPALACGCLIFAVLGCPVGLWANRADYLSTFVICFLPAVFIYYPLLLAGSGMGKDGGLPLWLGCWLANFVVGFFAVALSFRLLRR